MPNLIEVINKNDTKQLIEILTEWSREAKPHSHINPDPLIYAIQRANSAAQIENIKHLLRVRNERDEPFVDINAVDSEKRTALHHLLDNERISHADKHAIFDLMMDLRDPEGNLLIDMSACKWGHGTPLMDAIRINHLPIVRALLDLRKKDGGYAVDINEARSGFRHTALDVVYMHCHNDAIGLAIEEVVRNRGGRRAQDMNPHIIKEYYLLGKFHPLHPDFNPTPRNLLKSRANIAPIPVASSEPLIPMHKQSNNIKDPKIKKFILNRQSTHNTKVTLSGNASLIRLMRRYSEIDVENEINEIKAYFATLPKNNKTHLAFACFESILKDPTTRSEVNLTLKQGLALIWVALKDKNALLPKQIEITDYDVQLRKESLISNLAKVQNEYEELESNKESCFKGKFDAMLETVDRVHPEVVLITIDDATQIKRFAVMSMQSMIRNMLKSMAPEPRKNIYSTWFIDEENSPAKIFKDEMKEHVDKQLSAEFSTMLSKVDRQEIVDQIEYLQKPIFHYDVYNLCSQIDDLDSLTDKKSVNIARDAFKSKMRAVINAKYTGEDNAAKQIQAKLLDLKIVYQVAAALGDGRNGNKNNVKHDVFVIEKLNELDAIKDPVRQLKALETLFDLIKKNKELYMRRNDKHLLFFLSTKKDPVSATYQKHVKVLKEKYIAILKANVQTKQYGELMKLAEHSQLIDENRSNYSLFQVKQTSTRRKIEGIKALSFK